MNITGFLLTFQASYQTRVTVILSKETLQKLFVALRKFHTTRIDLPDNHMKCVNWRRFESLKCFVYFLYANLVKTFSYQ